MLSALSGLPQIRNRAPDGWTRPPARPLGGAPKKDPVAAPYALADGITVETRARFGPSRAPQRSGSCTRAPAPVTVFVAPQWGLRPSGPA